MGRLQQAVSAIAQVLLLLSFSLGPVFAATRFQTISAPTDPVALAEWLRDGEEGGRIWQVLAGAPTLALGPDARGVITDYLLSEVSPSELEKKLTEWPALEVATMEVLADVLQLSSSSLTEKLQTFIAELKDFRTICLWVTGNRGLSFNRWAMNWTSFGPSSEVSS